jgi:hypothetical protein
MSQDCDVVSSDRDIAATLRGQTIHSLEETDGDHAAPRMRKRNPMRTNARPRRARTVASMAALALAGALALGGCQFGTGDPGQDDGGAATGQEQAGDDGTDGSDGGGATEDAQESDGGGSAVVDPDAAGAGVDFANLGDPVATAEAPATVEGDEDATMTVALYGLHRQGDTVVATYSFQVHSDETDVNQYLYRYLGGTGWHPYAIDSVNLNRHGVIGSVDGNLGAQTEYQSTYFRPGQTYYAYAVFAAPPEDVTTMDVALVDGAPLATGVRIQ